MKFHQYAFLALGSLAALAATARPAGAEDPPRFEALLANGQHVIGNNLRDWAHNGANPHLENQPLLDPNRPLAWLHDRSLAPGAPPEAFVETHLGDRLPGKVVSYSSGGSLYEPAPAHFYVEPAGLAAPKRSDIPESVRVVERFVRRIVWRSRENHYQPGRIFFRDGGIVPFRAARFEGNAVRLLLAEGFRTAAFREIAEIHLPEVDRWDQYADELAALSPAGRTRLLQLETVDGLIATTSLDRLIASSQGNPQDYTGWLHAVQPAWSLDLLWVASGKVWMRRGFAPAEPPLSRFAPLANTSSWQKDRSSQGAALRTGEQGFGWGFGVHAPHSLEFALPSFAIGVRTLIGIDRAAARGGCIQGKILLEGNKLFESPILVGSETVIDSGRISFPAASPDQGNAPRKLTFLVDPVQQGRPAGADPLNIRDMTNWCDPVLLLEENRLAELVREKLLLHFPAWKGWEVTLPESFVAENMQANAREHSPFMLGFTAPDALVLRRAIEITPEQNWLLLGVRKKAGEKPTIDVRIGGQPHKELEIPAMKETADPPLSLSLAPFQQLGKPPVEVALTVTPSQKTVLWSSLQLTEQLPTLFTLFDEQGSFQNVDKQGSAEITEEDAHVGRKSVKLTPGGRFRIHFKEPIPVRKEPKWGEYRYVRFAFRKFGQGRICLELNHKNEATKPFRYDAGFGDPCFGQANRVWVQNLPDQWIVMTRDLANEFGEVDVTGLTLCTPDGEHAFFDQVYLARSEADFEGISAPPAEETNQLARRELAKPLLDKALPATVAIDYGEGRWSTGAIISPQGEVLTVGHAVIAPGREVTVHLPSGEEKKGTTKGVDRGLDLGMIQLADAADLPHLQPESPQDIPIPPLYIGVSHVLPYQAQARPEAHILEIRNLFRELIWTTFDIPDWTAGGPLVNDQGKLIGILHRRSQFGGFLFGRLGGNADEVLNRLRNNQVTGEWQNGSGPMIGVEIDSTRKGCKITKVIPDTPAASELKKGDVIERFEGKLVVSLDEIYESLADNDPGQQVEVEVLRKQETIKVRLGLIPRTP